MVKKCFGFVLVGILIVLLIGCASAPAEQRDEPAAFTADFAIEDLGDGIKKVTDAEGRVFLVIPEGQTPPAEYDNIPVINTPVERVLLTSTTQAGLISPLDVWDRIAGVAASADQWHIAEITEGLDNGSIAYVGEAWSPDYEKIRQLNPGLAFVYTGEFGLHDMIAKLDEMQIPYVVINDYLENDPRAEIEWVAFMSTFFNKYDEALDYIEQAKLNIDEIESNVGSKEKPKVAWGFIFEGTAHVPNAGSHSAAMIRLAGGEYVFNDIGVDQGGSIQISLEEFYSRAKDADVLIYSSILDFTPNIEAVIEAAPILEGIAPIQQGNVWAFTPQYFQMIHKRDSMIEDLAAIFHPGEFEAQGFYVNMPRN